LEEKEIIKEWFKKGKIILRGKTEGEKRGMVLRLTIHL